MNRNIGETSDKNSQMVDYMLHSSSTAADHEGDERFANESSLDEKLNYFQDVMQFADFGPRLNQDEEAAANKIVNHEETNNGIDDDPNVFFLKFPVLNDHLHDQEEHEHEHLMMFRSGGGGGSSGNREEEEARVVLSENDGKMNGLFNMISSSEQQQQEREREREVKINNKKKRGRSIKTSEEVESQRMTHIAVERNRRKQMNEHLRVLRSLMPTSYVQRGDQASIIGGAIEFVRELEQLLQCLESQKRRRLYGDNCPPATIVGGANSSAAAAAPPVVVDQDQQLPPHQPPFFPPAAAMIQPPPPPPPPLNNDHHNQMLMLNMHETSQEETAESKSCIADIEVKLLGFDAMIKILSRRRPGQLVKTIAALEDLQINILHTNITTIDQTVLYSFTVKVGGETRLTAEDIANSVQQIFTFIHAYDSI